MSTARPRATALASAALALALTATATACGGSSGDAGSGADAKQSSAGGAALRWTACDAPTAAQGGGRAPGKGWECAKLPVPLDYAKPDGERIDLALIRTRALDAKHRIGSLVFNFGGPGGSGVATLPSLADSYAKLRQRYDLVSFDPRGVGESAGVRCQSDKETDAANEIDATPGDDAAVRTYLAANKAYIDACVKNSGKVLPYVDTVSAARDMDRIRASVGDDKLHYFGISYGTELGGVYAHLYPQNVGRAVLDAVVDPTQDPLQGNLAQSKGFQLALDDYEKDCSSRSASCPGTDDITALLKRLDTQPLPTAQGRRLTQDEAVNGIAAALYTKDTWKYLTAGLEEALQKGTGNTLLLLFDSINGRSPDGHYSNLQPANRAVSCADEEQRYTVDDVKAHLAEFRSASPVFGESAAWSLISCTGWPVKGKAKTPEVGAKGAAPIVVVGNTGDPATPYAGAGRMASALGSGVGVEVTYRGEGHGAYNTGDPCMTRLVDAYLLEGTVPGQGVTCG